MNKNKSYERKNKSPIYISRFVIITNISKSLIILE